MQNNEAGSGPTFFQLSTPEGFYRLIKSTLDEVSRARTLNHKDIFFLAAGLTHLREWIAPGYGRNEREERGPLTDAEHFHDRLYNQCKSFKLVQELCNGTKHFQKYKDETGYEAGALNDDWEDFDSVPNFDEGPPTVMRVNGRNVLDIFQEVLDYYTDHWFERQNS